VNGFVHRRTVKNKIGEQTDCVSIWKRERDNAAAHFTQNYNYWGDTVHAVITQKIQYFEQ